MAGERLRYTLDFSDLQTWREDEQFQKEEEYMTAHCRSSADAQRCKPHLHKFQPRKNFVAGEHGSQANETVDDAEGEARGDGIKLQTRTDHNT